MQRVSVLLGSQWGDEGKGKVVDWLVHQHQIDWVVRFQGGNNAGHTLVTPHGKLVLRLLPSGMLHPKARCLLGNGMVINPLALLEEIEQLEEWGIPLAGRLHLAANASLLISTHMDIDYARESSRNPIGTTRRGIGPAYEDKIARRALRVGDWLDKDLFDERLSSLLQYHRSVLSAFGVSMTSEAEIREKLWAVREKLLPLVVDGVSTLAQAKAKGERILFEGAQGTFLDVDQGTYPYVTSSNTSVAGVASGTGFPPGEVQAVFGLVKAYTTRVGEGPFPTEDHGESGRWLASQGNEFGSVTGRPRRCGWLDLPLIRRAHQLNHFEALCLTKLDVLDGLSEIPVCVAYENEDWRLGLSHMKPVYQKLPGWSESVSGATRFEALPEAAQAYVKFIEESLGVSIRWISTGAERDAMIER